MARKRWTNWAGNRSCTSNVVTPRSRDELRDAVREAAQAGRRVRATGGSYSWSPLVENPDTIVRMHRLDREIEDGGAPGTIHVECGMTIAKLDELARGRGHTLISPTMFPRPSVGGVIATCSHGTGFHVGSFADQVVEMTIVRADGSLDTVRRGDRDYPAAQVALGSLGIVYSARIELVPQFNVFVDKRHVPVRYVLEEFDDLLRSCRFLEILWFPFQSKMWLYLMDPTPSQPDPPSRWKRWLTAVSTWVQVTAGRRLLPWVARHTPSLTPVLNWAASRLVNKAGVSVQTASQAFHFLKAYPKAFDISYAVRADRAAQAWRAAIELVEEYARADLYPVNLALHCRFTAPGQAWLGPDQLRPTCWIEVATARHTPHWEEFFREVEERWLALDDEARPHWGKLYWSARELAGRYPRMQEFLDVRQRWDPQRVFLNRFLEEEVFQLPRPQPTVPGPAPQPARPAPPTPVPGPPTPA